MEWTAPKVARFRGHVRASGERFNARTVHDPNAGASGTVSKRAAFRPQPAPACGRWNWKLPPIRHVTGDCPPRGGHKSPHPVKHRSLPNRPLQRTWSSLTLGTTPLNAKVVGQTSEHVWEEQIETTRTRRAWPSGIRPAGLRTPSGMGSTRRPTRLYPLWPAWRSRRVRAHARPACATWGTSIRPARRNASPGSAQARSPGFRRGVGEWYLARREDSGRGLSRRPV